MLLQFLFPYFMACYSAGFAVLQTLDGLGIVSTNYVEFDNMGHITSSYLSPSQSAQAIASILMWALIIALPFFFISLWILMGMKGVIASLFILVTPGLISILGYFPTIQWLPSRYFIQGTGSVGDATGMFLLISAGLTLGWITTIIISDILSTGEKFRQWSDIFIILTAIANGIFWVSDKDINSVKNQYAETVRDVNNAAQYLLTQTRDYSDMCVRTGITQKASCEWASYIQETLSYIVSLSPGKTELFIPGNMSDFYKIHTRNTEKNTMNEIRKELYDYNRTICPIKNLSAGVRQLSPPSFLCKRTPFAYCNANQNWKYATESLETIAISNECVFSSILNYRLVLERNTKTIMENARTQHYRWLWFIILSMLLGVKIANIMTKIFCFEKKEHQKRIK
ncbi:hypothetical protein SMQE08_34610 [Serratia marcescens]|nr:hypothetical protein SMQE08_34610 [Serratia marcescens]